MVYNRLQIAFVSALRPPRMPALRRSEHRPCAEKPPGADRRPWARGYNSLSLENGAARSGLPCQDRISQIKAYSLGALTSIQIS